MRITTRIWNTVNLKSTLTFLVISAGIIAFTVTGVGFNMSSRLDSTTAAKVGDQTISIRRLEEAVSELDRQSHGDPERRKANVQSALDDLIREKILIEESNRIGWGATDVEVAEWVKSNPAFRNKDTKEFDYATYKRFKEQSGISELDFYRMGRDEISRRKLISLVTLTPYMPKKLAEEEHARNAASFDLEMRDASPPADVARKAAAAKAETFAKDPANDKKLKDLYESSKTEFSRKAQVRVRSILIAWKDAQRAQGDALKRSEADAKALADKRRAEAASGADFAKLATETNDDALAKQAKGDLGFIDASGIDEASAKAAFALSASHPLSETVKTPYGYRILKWEASRPAIERSFADVKGELALRLVEPEVKAKLEGDLEKQLSDALAAKDAKKVESIADGAHLAPWKKISKPVTPESRFIDELGVADPVVRVLFGMKKPGDMAPRLIEVSGRKVFLRLLARREAPPADAKALTDERRTASYRYSQNFISEAQRKLFEVYTRNKEIQRNKALLQ